MTKMPKQGLRSRTPKSQRGKPKDNAPRPSVRLTSVDMQHIRRKANRDDHSVSKTIARIVKTYFQEHPEEGGAA